MNQPQFEVFKLRRYKNRPGIIFINDILSLAVLLLAFYILFFPFLPQLTFYFTQSSNENSGFHYVGNLAHQYNIPEEKLLPIPEENTLVIPQIDVNGLIYEGQSVATLDQGIWHRPNTSTPDQGGNTVFVAHRFLYQSGPNTFYHLDKLQPGDQFIVFWEGKKYDYQVIDTFVVPATALYIEDPTEDPIVTLYTCTPLWTSTHRLVVKARPLAPISTENES